MKKITRKKAKKVAKKRTGISPSLVTRGRPVSQDPDEYISKVNRIVPVLRVPGRRAIGRPKGNHDTERNKKKFLAALTKSYGIVSIAARSTGISRDAHRLWMEKDAEYREAVAKIKDDLHDFVESKIISSINKEVPAMMIYFAKTQMAHRGYREKSEQIISGPNGGPVQLGADVNVQGKIETYNNEVTPGAVVSIVKELVGDDSKVKHALEKLKSTK